MPHGEPWLDDPLGYLIGTERTLAFFDRVYEREALIAQHGDLQRFEGLISIDDVDRFVTETDLREGELVLANATSPIDASSYIDTAGYVDRGAVADFHRHGATIILNQAHRIEPKLARFCRGLEHVFSSHVQTNLYLTPPNAQGFGTHFDNHDVFVIQVEGEKHWRLYDFPVETPFRGEGFQSRHHAAGELRQEFVMRAGDCAYVPRGMMHDALTSGELPSLHVTVGLITRTWADLALEAVSEVALRSPELRRSLPAGFARMEFDRAEAATYLRRVADIIAGELQLDPALDVMTDAFIRSRAAYNRKAIVDAARPVPLDRRYIRTPFVPYRIADDADDVAIVVAGGDLTFPGADRPAVEHALSGKPFVPTELAVANPAGMMAKLLAYGLVTAA